MSLSRRLNQARREREAADRAAKIKREPTARVISKLRADIAR